MQQQEFDAGLGQTMVVYVSDDTSDEVDASSLYAQVAEDARQHAAKGQRITAISAAPLRHAGVYLGREGSGYETKICVTVVYSG